MLGCQFREVGSFVVSLLHGCDEVVLVSRKQTKSSAACCKLWVEDSRPMRIGKPSSDQSEKELFRSALLGGVHLPIYFADRKATVSQ